MTEAMRGDVITKSEMKMRGIVLMPSERGGVELRALSSMHTIAMELINLGFIEPFHATDASIFMDLRRAYHASQHIKWGYVNVTLDGAELTAGQATERYDAIRHEMGIKKAVTIARIIEQAMMEQYYRMRAEQQNVYRMAFELLSDTMLSVKRKYA